MNGQPNLIPKGHPTRMRALMTITEKLNLLYFLVCLGSTKVNIKSRSHRVSIIVNRQITSRLARETNIAKTCRYIYIYAYMVSATNILPTHCDTT